MNSRFSGTSGQIRVERSQKTSSLPCTPAPQLPLCRGEGKLGGRAFTPSPRRTLGLRSCHPLEMEGPAKVTAWAEALSPALAPTRAPEWAPSQPWFGGAVLVRDAHGPFPGPLSEQPSWAPTGTTVLYLTVRHLRAGFGHSSTRSSCNTLVAVLMPILQTRKLRLGQGHGICQCFSEVGSKETQPLGLQTVFWEAAQWFLIPGSR